MNKQIVSQKKRRRTALRDDDSETSHFATEHVSVAKRVKHVGKSDEALQNEKSSCASAKTATSPLASNAVTAHFVTHGGDALHITTTLHTECAVPTTLHYPTLSDDPNVDSARSATQTAGKGDDKDEMELRHDPIYRIMHAIPRSDVLEVVKCRFGSVQCARALKYFDMSYTQNPLRKLRLQIGCDGATGMHGFFPRIFQHRYSLRTLDLSRNKLTADDIATLCTGLGFHGQSHLRYSALNGVERTYKPLDETSVASGGYSSQMTFSETAWQQLCNTSKATTQDAHAVGTQSTVELLDLSYNADIGNSGAVLLLNALRGNTSIRAVQLKRVNIDDEGACRLAPLLRTRPRAMESTPSSFARDNSTQSGGFFINLNENRIGACGTRALGCHLPDYVSITLCKQRVQAARHTSRPC